MKMKVIFTIVSTFLFAFFMTLFYGSNSVEAFASNKMAINTSSGTILTEKNMAYDDIFTDINQAVFIKRFNAQTDGDGDGNCFTSARIDVVDENGYDHQGMLYVCYGSEEFTKTYQNYLTQLQKTYNKDYGAIAAYRNAATKGYRTYRDHDIEFFCLQEVTFTDNNGIEQKGVIIAIDGSENFTSAESELWSDFIDYYTLYNKNPLAHKPPQLKRTDIF